MQLAVLILMLMSPFLSAQSEQFGSLHQVEFTFHRSTEAGGRCWDYAGSFISLTSSVSCSAILWRKDARQYCWQELKLVRCLCWCSMLTPSIWWKFLNNRQTAHACSSSWQQILFDTVWEAKYWGLEQELAPHYTDITVSFLANLCDVIWAWSVLLLIAFDCCVFVAALFLFCGSWAPCALRFSAWNQWHVVLGFAMFRCCELPTMFFQDASRTQNHTCSSMQMVDIAMKCTVAEGVLCRTCFAASWNSATNCEASVSVHNSSWKLFIGRGI